MNLLSAGLGVLMALMTIFLLCVGVLGEDFTFPREFVLSGGNGMFGGQGLGGVFSERGYFLYWLSTFLFISWISSELADDCSCDPCEDNLESFLSTSSSVIGGGGGDGRAGAMTGGKSHSVFSLLIVWEPEYCPLMGWVCIGGGGGGGRSSSVSMGGGGKGGVGGGGDIIWWSQVTTGPGLVTHLSVSASDLVMSWAASRNPAPELRWLWDFDARSRSTFSLSDSTRSGGGGVSSCWCLGDGVLTKLTGCSGCCKTIFCLGVGVLGGFVSSSCLGKDGLGVGVCCCGVGVLAFAVNIWSSGVLNRVLDWSDCECWELISTLTTLSSSWICDVWQLIDSEAEMVLTRCCSCS